MTRTPAKKTKEALDLVIAKVRASDPTPAEARACELLETTIRTIAALPNLIETIEVLKDWNRDDLEQAEARKLLLDAGAYLLKKIDENVTDPKPHPTKQ